VSDSVTLAHPTGGDGEAKVAKAREGLAALDAHLATIDGRPVGPDERNQMVALVLSVDETLRELEVWSGNGSGAKTGKPRRLHRRLHRRLRRTRFQSSPPEATLADLAANGGPQDATVVLEPAAIDPGAAAETEPIDVRPADVAPAPAERPPDRPSAEPVEHLSIDEEYRQDLADRVRALRAELDERAGRVLVLTTDERERPRRRLAGLFGPVVTQAPTAAGTATTAALPAALRSRRSAERTVGKVLTAAGVIAVLFLAFEFGLTGALEARDQRALLLQFQSAIVTTQLDLPNKPIPAGTAVALLDIPSIHVNQVVIEGTTNRLLKAGPGHLADAPLPGEFGNAIILGHRTKYGGPFRNINLLHTGDVINVTTGQGLFIYSVHHVYHLESGDPDVFAGSADSRLTLVSADPPQGASGRIVAVALLRGNPVAVDSRPPVPVGRDELGLAADPVGAVFGLIWLQLFIVAYLITRRIRRTWNPTVTWLLATPILLALLLLVFINVDLLLPGTL
jgi:LPXTG-site transpeptidase (sortase) family protein